MRQQAIEYNPTVGAHSPDCPLLRVLPYRICILQNGLTFGRKVQTTATATGGRIHDDMAKRQKTLEIARQCRLLDVEVVSDLDGSDSVT